MSLASQSNKISSQRGRHEQDDEEDDFNADKEQFDRKANKTYDMEVYDDRAFYSMLLKVTCQYPYYCVVQFFG